MLCERGKNMHSRRQREMLLWGCLETKQISRTPDQKHAVYNNERICLTTICLQSFNRIDNILFLAIALYKCVSSKRVDSNNYNQ